LCALLLWWGVHPLRTLRINPEGFDLQMSQITQRGSLYWRENQVGQAMMIAFREITRRDYNQDADGKN
ncbi:MAG: hypothetical protein ACK47M_19925, partial [Caldilinea sp.]